MLTKIKRESSTDTSRMIYLPFLSGIHFSILQSSFGFISIITPLLFDVQWLKKALPPHSADQVSAVSLDPEFQEFLYNLISLYYSSK